MASYQVTGNRNPIRNNKAGGNNNNNNNNINSASVVINVYVTIPDTGRVIYGAALPADTTVQQVKEHSLDYPSYFCFMNDYGKAGSPQKLGAIAKRSRLGNGAHLTLEARPLNGPFSAHIPDGCTQLPNLSRQRQPRLVNRWVVFIDTNVALRAKFLSPEVTYCQTFTVRRELARDNDSLGAVERLYHELPPSFLRGVWINYYAKVFAGQFIPKRVPYQKSNKKRKEQ